MSVLITTNEPAKIRNLFVDRIEVPMGFDFMLYTEAGKICIERKAVPGDLLSSVEDGRLCREIIAMRDEGAINIVLLHGNITYRKDGTVDTGKRSWGRTWTRKGLRNLLRTLTYVEGCYIEEARNSKELVETMSDLQSYFDSKSHMSLKNRPGIMTDWVVSTHEEKVRYFYDGIPGIGIVGAQQLVKSFPSPLNLYQATVEQIMQIKGFGKTTANSIYNFLRGT